MFHSLEDTEFHQSPPFSAQFETVQPFYIPLKMECSVTRKHGYFWVRDRHWDEKLSFTPDERARMLEAQKSFCEAPTLFTCHLRTDNHMFTAPPSTVFEKSFALVNYNGKILSSLSHQPLKYTLNLPLPVHHGTIEIVIRADNVPENLGCYVLNAHAHSAG